MKKWQENTITILLTINALIYGGTALYILLTK